MRELLEYLARALVDDPESVSVEEFEEDDGTIVLELAVAEDDYGKIIGRGGRGPQGPPLGVDVAGADDWLSGGRVGRPHGLDGSFHVTGARAALLAVGVTVRPGERDTDIVRRAGTDERPIVRLAGVESREAADALRGAE